MRRLVQVNRWLDSQPLWRVAPVYYALVVLAGYVASWTMNRPPPPGDSTFWHLTGPALLTVGVILGLALRRRRAGR